MITEISYDVLRLLKPHFDSPLTDLIIDLDHLRRKQLGGSTQPQIFFQLKRIFHLLESLESARIEGNRTTLAEAVDQKIRNAKLGIDSMREIENVELAIEFIDENIRGNSLDRLFLSEIHKMVVKGLSENGEGDPTPGVYRQAKIQIAGSNHVPPDYVQVDGYMGELFDFINRDGPAKYDLIKTALAHHRLVWIHPFRNGNGRTVRLLTYAMLVKQGFNVNVGRILNPTAIFCNDRQMYYDKLSAADTGEDAPLLSWCEYVLSGLKTEIIKIDKLLDHSFLSSEILEPALAMSKERNIITSIEEKILRVAVAKQIFQASDLKQIFPTKAPQEVSRIIANLRDKSMLVPISANARKYHIHFFNNYLLRGVMEMLKTKGFVAMRD